MRMKAHCAVWVLSILLAAGLAPDTGAQAPPVQEEVADGVFELTLKTPDRKTIVVDKLVRDQDLDPQSLFRVKTSGYLGFTESEWVDSVQFKVFDIPVTEMPDYKEFAELLVRINKKIWDIRGMLQQYNQRALRLMRICEQSEFSNLKDIDSHIVPQLAIYRELMLLRALVVNSMDRFVAQRSCVDRFNQYKTDLKMYTQRLTGLCQEFDRLKKKALEAAEREPPATQEGQSSTKKPQE